MTVLDCVSAANLTSRITDGPGGYSGVDGDEEWAAEVRRLADLRGATLLAHNYQLPAIQDVARTFVKASTAGGPDPTPSSCLK